MFGIFLDFIAFISDFSYELVLFIVFLNCQISYVHSGQSVTPFECSLYQNVQHIMNSSSSKFGDFRRFIYIFKVCFGEEQKSCQNI